jgi:hypothetical protein
MAFISVKSSLKCGNRNTMNITHDQAAFMSFNGGSLEVWNILLGNNDFVLNLIHVDAQT